MLLQQEAGSVTEQPWNELIVSTDLTVTIRECRMKIPLMIMNLLILYILCCCKENKLYYQTSDA